MSEPMSRRRFLRHAVGGVLGLGLPAIGGTAYITRVEPDLIEVARLTLPLPNLPPAFDGTTLVQISDLHLGGGWMTEARLRAVAEQVNALEPDLIAVTGDFVSAIWGDVPGQITRTLSALRASEGVFAILGNHDHWTHAPTVRQAIRQVASVRLLSNEHVVLRRGDAALYLAGIDDVWERQHDLNRALRSIPDGAAVILLAHEPDVADDVAATGRVGLQLSGHSHGGQVRLPGIGALRLPYLGQKYDMGLYDITGMTLYVNRGVGMIAPHVRFNCRPEITHLTLGLSR